jgi:hypothetical protein
MKQTLDLRRAVLFLGRRKVKVRNVQANLYGRRGLVITQVRTGSVLVSVYLFGVRRHRNPYFITKFTDQFLTLCL